MKVNENKIVEDYIIKFLENKNMKLPVKIVEKG